MKQKNVITISAAAVAVIAVLGLSAYTFAAGGGEGWGNKLGQKINPENREQFEQMRDLIKEGKTEEAKVIAEELGLPAKQNFKGMSSGKGMNAENFEEIKAAIETGDYEAWSNLKQGSRMTEMITEENFDKLVQMHNLMQEGKTAEAMVIRQELGIPGKGKGMGMGGGRLCGACPMNK